MGAIEDTRKVMQDFLAPELREIRTRLESLEKRFDVSDHRAERRHELMMLALSDYTDVRVRLALLESKQSAHQ